MADDDTDNGNDFTPVFDIPKGGLYGGGFDSAGLDPNVRAVLMDYRWTTSFGGSQPALVITYAFPTSAADYNAIPGGYPDDENLAQFVPVTDFQKEAARTAFGLVSSYTNLTFVEVTSGLASDAAFRFAQYADGGSESNFPANNGPYSPSDSRLAGDTWLGGNGNPPANYFGTDHLNTIMHEMGHAFGLKHGHDPSYNGALAPQFNDNEFSVMTYASYFGADTNGATEAWVGSAPQSYMMFDIAALQALYGANFSKVGTEAVYSWDPTTGQQYINGQEAPFTGVSDTGKIFSTVWTEGATTTYDLSAFSDDQVDDMRPGYWLRFSHAQLADLNNMAPQGTPEYQAQGNIYNALLYQDDWRSAVSNLITGSGDDRITGNDIDNIIVANAGDDWISGGAGNDTISGGAGMDTIIFGSGHNTLRDTLADLQGDTIVGLTTTSTLDILNARIDRGDIQVAKTAGLATLTIGTLSFEFHGDFSGGDFMAPARNLGPDAHTDISFVNYLPTLSEGVRVDLDAINGIANQPFLSGDGSVSFTMQMESAISSFANMLGYYLVSVDGTISDVHLAFENTLAGGNFLQTVGLGTPDAGERIGFFLVQDGYNLFGGLPDDLSFLAPDQSGAADLDAGFSPLLYSASRGVISGATVFHSFADLNAGDEVHVLSGTAEGGETLRIGFEDLPTTTGDNDFQDVVFSIHTSSDLWFV